MGVSRDCTAFRSARCQAHREATVLAGVRPAQAKLCERRLVALLATSCSKPSRIDAPAVSVTSLQHHNMRRCRM